MKQASWVTTTIILALSLSAPTSDAQEPNATNSAISISTQIKYPISKQRLIKSVQQLSTIQGTALGCVTAHTTSRVINSNLNRPNNQNQYPPIEEREFGRIANAANGVIYLLLNDERNAVTVKITEVHHSSAFDASDLTTAMGTQQQTEINWSTQSLKDKCNLQLRHRLISEIANIASNA